MDLSTPVFTIEGLETKFDLNISSNSIAIKFGDYLEAMVFQKLHYCIQQGYGVVIDGKRWIYKSIDEWIRDWFPILTPWKMNQILVSLVEKGYVSREHLFDKHHGHNFHAKNRTLYYSPNYENFLEDEINLEDSADKVTVKTNPEDSAKKRGDSRFLNNQKTQLCPDDLQVSVYPENKSDNTSIENNQTKQKKIPSPTPPFDSPKKSKPRPKLKVGTRPKTQSEMPIKKNTRSGGGNSSPISSISKPITKDKGTQPNVELSQVIERPNKPDIGYKAVREEGSRGDVEQKVNKQYVGTTPTPPVQEVVLNLELEPPVQETVPTTVVQESAQVESTSPPKPKRQKTRKGTKPKKRTHDHALWKTMEERNNFERELTHRVVNGVGKARNPMALVRYVMNQITQGISHPYWEEWISGVVIGTCETQEWEASPGHPYPKFVEYLVEKLKYDEESRSQAHFRLGKILDDVSKARLHWREFKRIIEGLRQDADKAAANGQQVALPVWFIERAEISLERAGESAQTLTKLAPEQTDWIYRGLPESEKLLTAAANSLQPGIPELPPGEPESKPPEITIMSDLWADDDNDGEDEDFCFNGFIDMGYLEQQAKKVAANPGKLSLLLMDFKSAVAQATLNQREKIRRMLTPIYPELLDFL